MCAYTGCLLRIDLSSGKARKEYIPVELRRQLIGGRGFGIHYLFQEISKGIDPLGEQNRLLFLPGLMAGTKAIGFGRWIVMTKSPLTGALARSVGGGNFAAFMKFAGYDFILVEGKSERPCYVLIHEDGA